MLRKFMLMSIQLPPNPAPNAAKTYISLPPEPDEAPDRFFSAKFVIFTILVIGGATAGGLVQSGKISLHQILPIQKAPVQASAPKAAPSAPRAAPTAVPVPPLKPDTFIVTSISIGQPSFAIINGISRVEGDPVQAPGVTGWKVSRVLENAVLLQNGSAFASLPLSTPGLKPLDDALHPLN
jgi:hypothetical protein